MRRKKVLTTSFAGSQIDRFQHNLGFPSPLGLFITFYPRHLITNRASLARLSKPGENTVFALDPLPYLHPPSFARDSRVTEYS